MIEQVVLEQLILHLNKVKAIPGDQSAYRKNHSTETALLGMLNDVLSNADDSKCSMLVLLDLSAAFDAVVHDYLFSDLASLGITGDALQWFKSYLANRYYSVQIGKSRSI